MRSGDSSELKLQSESEDEKRARRIAHVFVAVAAMGFVALAVFGLNKGSSFMKERQIRMIQRSAMADLNLVADALKAFKEKHGFYTTDLKALQIWPKYALYAFGFVTASQHSPEQISTLGLQPEVRTLSQLVEARTQDAIEASKKDRNILPGAPIKLSPVTGIRLIDLSRLAAICPDCTATADSYKVMVAAQLDPDEDLDVWTIDQTGAVTHVSDDLNRRP